MARRRQGTSWTLIILSVVVVVGIGWLVWRSSKNRQAGPPETAQASESITPLPGDLPTAAPGRSEESIPETPASLEPAVTLEEPAPQPSDAEPAKDDPALAAARQLIEQGREAMRRGDWLAARDAFSAAAADLGPAEQEQLREDRLAVAERTVWSREPVPGDPLTTWYTVKKGDNLLRVGDAFRITPALIARLNGLKNANVIRAGQRLKVINGPFHAVVERKAFRLSVYLGEDKDVLVAVFPIGLGAEGSTPLGMWKVKNKLTNPTYHPPRGGRVVPADDPDNPLGEYWIGLEGLSDEALGQEGYGIHGTIDEDSIGRNVSMGCIRLLGGDIDQLFAMLVEPYSTVLIRD